MSNYFQNFPVVDYRFGNESSMTKFQHLGTNIDMLEKIKEYTAYYQSYNIQNGERPEIVSYRLYGDVNFYWTFYLLNDKLRQQGWPIRESDVFSKAQEYYPNTVIGTNATVRDVSPNFIPATGEIIFIPDPEGFYPLSKSEYFKVGSWVWFEYSKSFGQILKVDQETGFIYTDAKNIRGVEDYAVSISYDDIEKLRVDSEHKPETQYAFIEIKKVWDEFDAPHHYEDVEGNWVYPYIEPTYPFRKDLNTMRRWDPSTSSWVVASTATTVNSVSNYERIVDLNESQKVISVIRADVITQVAAEFNRLMKNHNGSYARV